MKWLAYTILLLSLAVAAPASAQFYKFMDQQGNIRFTDDINQVPENQRSKARSYAAAQPTTPAATVPENGEEKRAADRDPADGSSADPGMAASVEEQPIDAARSHLENLKKQVDADYQALSREKDALSKEKEAPKTREQVVDYNKRVEVFNQKAASYEARSNDLRKQVETYNARVIEENAQLSQSSKK
ncbi:MAG: DUF4124 domain-containing protein [Desulfobacterales bacterium]|jgi:hypothetical protein|nr:DUF4124 domain-containing protein [Desulfobacterales bacterium]